MPAQPPLPPTSLAPIIFAIFLTLQSFVTGPPRIRNVECSWRFAALLMPWSLCGQLAASIPLKEKPDLSMLVGFCSDSGARWAALG